MSILRRWAARFVTLGVLVGSALTGPAAAPSAAAATGVECAPPCVNAAFAIFDGPLSVDLRRGTSTNCNEIVLTVNLTCTVDFTLDKPICDVDLNERVGTASYVSPRPNFSIRDIALFGGSGSGAGVLQSGPILRIIDGIVYVFEMTIEAIALCDEGSGTRVFHGKVTYL